MNETLCLSASELRAPFKLGQAKHESVGIEIELGAVNPNTGLPIPYEGESGINLLLNDILTAHGVDGIIERDRLIGVKLPNSGTITLEPGGAVEYSSPPFESLAKLSIDVEAKLQMLATAAKRRNVSLMATGSFPFQKLVDARWMPKQRYDVMRAYFKNLGFAGRDAWRMMSQTLSVQTAVDFFNEDDLVAKFHALTIAAPIATALFANSPIEEGETTGCVSRRGQIWLATDPSRCGFVPPGINADMKLDDYIDWALDVPSIYREVPSGFTALKGRPFRDIAAHGFADKVTATLNDWEVHLGSIFTDVRLKHFLEIRAMDGQGYNTILAVPAFWAGLLYHKPNLQKVSELLGGRSLADYQSGLADIVVRGLRAEYLGLSVQTIAQTLLTLAREGLQHMVDSGKEPSSTLDLLNPLDQMVDSGLSSGDILAREWNGSLNRDPAKFVALTAVPVL